MAEYRYVSHPYKRKKNGRPASCQEHVRVWLLIHGEIPEGHIIHHINGDKYDNRIENLRCMNRRDHALLHSLRLENPDKILPNGPENNKEDNNHASDVNKNLFERVT